MKLFYLLPLLAIFTLGCATRVYPPDPQTNFVQVHIANYGYHSSLILPEGDSPVEYAYGDWEYFALNKGNLCQGAFALLMSDPGALGMRTLQSAESAEGILAQLDAKRIYTLNVDPEKVKTLSANLHARYALHEDQKVYNSENQLTFVPDDKRYSLAFQCNSQVADWLTELGCRVPDAAFLSEFKIESNISQ